MDLRVATYRVDVRRPCDVIEEILRIYGYNNVEMGTTLQSSLSYRSATDIDHTLKVNISQQLTAEGFNEILNNSLTSESYYAHLQQMQLDHCVRLLNPLSSDLCVMRQTLLFGGLESLAHNINRKISDLAMYEFGHVYSFNPEATPTQEHPLAPYREESRLALWITGNIRPGNWARPAQPSTSSSRCPMPNCDGRNSHKWLPHAKSPSRRCRARCPYSATSPCSSTAPSHSTRYSAQSPKAKSDCSAT